MLLFLRKVGKTVKSKAYSLNDNMFYRCEALRMSLQKGVDLVWFSKNGCLLPEQVFKLSLKEMSQF